MQSTTQPKKNTAKDGKKNQQPGFTEAEVDVANAQGPFEVALFKKLRNQRKKLREIEELEVKMKAKDFSANDAQREKVASKPKIAAEYDEVKQHAALYLEQKRQQDKEQKKKVDTAKRQAVRTVAQVIALSTIVQKGHSLPGEDAEQVAQSVEHFRKCLRKFMNEDGGAYAWADELAAITSQWNKLVLGHQDSIFPGSSMSFKDLLDRLPEILNDQVLPAEIEDKVDQPPEEPEPCMDQNADDGQEDEDVPDAACDMGTAFADAFGSDSDDDNVAAPVQAPKAVSAPPVAQQKEQEEEKEGENPVAEDGEADGAKADGEGEGEKKEGDRGRRGGRGRDRPWRQRGRGEGQDGDGGYRGKREFRGDRRPRTAKPRGGDPDDDFNDFTVVGKQADGRGRGRGGRGRGRGNYRGDRGDGSGRGGRGNRGDRGFRGRGGEKGPTENGNVEMPGVALAQNHTNTAE